MVVFSANVHPAHHSWQGHSHSPALALPHPSAEMQAWGCGQLVAHSWPNLLVNSAMQHLAHLTLVMGSWRTISACDLSWELLTTSGNALGAPSPSCLYVTGIASQMPP